MEVFTGRCSEDEKVSGFNRVTEEVLKLSISGKERRGRTNRREGAGNAVGGGGGHYVAQNSTEGVDI